MVVYALRTVFHNNIFNNYEAVIIPIISTTWKVKAGKFQVSGGPQQSHATSSQIYIYIYIDYTEHFVLGTALFIYLGIKSRAPPI